MDENEENHQQEEAEVEPSYRSKRLRLADPDLKVTCQFGKGRGAKEKTFECHGLIMAGHSQYFDNLMSSEMEESFSKHVTLEDVDPDVFEKGMELLENTVQIAAAGPKEILHVASFYNRFQFQQGLKLAESVLGKFLDLSADTVPSPGDMNLIVDSICFAEESGIASLNEKALEFLRVRFSESTFQGIGLFRVKHMEKMQPFLIAHSGELFAKILRIVEDCPEIIMRRQDFSHSSFPRLLVEKFQRTLNLDIFRSQDVQVKVSWTLEYSQKENKRRELTLDLIDNCSYFEFRSNEDSDSDSDDDESDFALLEQHLGEDCDTYQNGDWILCIRDCEGYSFTFVFPFSKHSLLPPTTDGWVQLGDSHGIKTNVTVKHVFGPWD